MSKIAVIKYKEQQLKWTRLIREGKEDTKEEEELLNEMDSTWCMMTSEEMKQFFMPNGMLEIEEKETLCEE